MSPAQILLLPALLELQFPCGTALGAPNSCLTGAAQKSPLGYPLGWQQFAPLLIFPGLANKQNSSRTSIGTQQTGPNADGGCLSVPYIPSIDIPKALPLMLRHFLFSVKQPLEFLHHFSLQPPSAIIQRLRVRLYYRHRPLPYSDHLFQCWSTVLKSNRSQ